MTNIHSITNIIIYVIISIIIGGLYLLPIIISIFKHTTTFKLVFVNVVFGTFIIGWILPLIWSLSPKRYYSYNPQNEYDYNSWYEQQNRERERIQRQERQREEDEQRFNYHSY